MLVTVSILLVTCGIVQCSEIHQAPAGSAPVVTAASSQYFERTFNRLVAVPSALEPAVPLAPAPVAVFPGPPPRPFLSVLPIAPASPAVVEATRTTAVPVTPTDPPPPPALADPNIAIAVATAHAAPVATILLPPYPFGFPPSFGAYPQAPRIPQDLDTKESTTLKTTTTVHASTTRKEEITTPVPSNIDNGFAQASSNQNVNFGHYPAPSLPSPGQQFSGPDVRPQQNPLPNQSPQQFPLPNQRPRQFPERNQTPQQFPLSNQRPQQLPLPNQTPQQPTLNPWSQQIPQHLPLPEDRPIKFKTNVEIVPVPLEYIAPPPEQRHHHHHHHHQPLKVVPHFHKFIPQTSKIIIIRPVTSSRIRTVRVPAGLATYGPPKVLRRVAVKRSRNVRFQSREYEPTTFKPINKPFTKSPRL